MKKTIVLLLILVNLAAFGQKKDSTLFKKNLLTFVRPIKAEWGKTYSYQLVVQDSANVIYFEKKESGDSAIIIKGDTTKVLWMLYKYLMDKPISHFKQ